MEKKYSLQFSYAQFGFDLRVSNFMPIQASE